MLIGLLLEFCNLGLQTLRLRNKLKVFPLGSLQLGV